METCVGCGSKSGRHPVVGLARRGDIEGDRLAENGDYVAHPICGDCHRDPSRRKPGIKMHFYYRQDLSHAMERAGSMNLGG